MKRLITTPRPKAARVYFAEPVTSGGSDVAIKYCPKKTSLACSDEYDLGKEGKLNHPNVLHPLTHAETATDYITAWEWSSLGTVKSHIQKGERFSATTIRFIIRDVIDGLKYLHAQGYEHQDLHTDNVFLFLPTESQASSGVKYAAKIGDFDRIGVASEFNMTPMFLADECSVAQLIGIMLSGQLPKTDEDYVPGEPGCKLGESIHLPTGPMDILTNTCTMDDRKSLQWIRDHEWMKDVK